MVPSQSIRYIQYQEDKSNATDADVIVETPVSLTVNGRNWLTFMCTPIMLEEMAIGFLFNEGVVSNIEDIADVRICEHEDNVDVWLTHSVEEPASWRRTSGCSGGVTAVDLISERLPSVPIQNDLISPEQITALVAGLFESQELYKETGGVHTTALCDGQDIILSAEDIGRHNTLDNRRRLSQAQTGAPSIPYYSRKNIRDAQKASRLQTDVNSVHRHRRFPFNWQSEWNHLIGYARQADLTYMHMPKNQRIVVFLADMPVCFLCFEFRIFNY
jgi:formate dehydrogenase accessory protein FdhD